MAAILVEQIYLGQSSIQMAHTCGPEFHQGKGLGDLGPAKLLIHIPIRVGCLSGRTVLYYLGRVHISAPHHADFGREWEDIGLHALEGGYQGCLR